MQETVNNNISKKFKIAAFVSIGIIVISIICIILYFILILNINPMYDYYGNYTEDELKDVRLRDGIAALMIVSLFIGSLNIPALILGFKYRSRTYEMIGYKFYWPYGIRGIVVGCISLNAFMISAGVAALNYSKQEPNEEEIEF